MKQAGTSTSGARRVLTAGSGAPLAVLALLALVAVLFTGRIPDRPPGG